MNDPYKVLGVSQQMSDEELKEVYRGLARKYHPDNYMDTPLKEVAEEKMKEVNEAYDSIMSSRRSNPNNGQKNSSYTQSNPYAQQQGYAGASSSSSSMPDIRRLIRENRIVDAEELLDGIPIASRNAEWYFLKGSVYHSRGWLDDAANHFSTACRMDSTNPEYRAAFNRMQSSRNGNFNAGTNPYRTGTGGTANGCSACNMCQGLICADCCCECMGGDLISCC